MWNVKKIVPLLLALLPVLSISSLHAQEGMWIDYSLDGFGSGAYMYDCGDGCCAYTRANSQYVLIFDVEIADWLKADLGSVRVFNDLLSEGSVVLGWSQDLLFGYSAITSNWDTIPCEGTVLRENNSQLFRSYGCSDSIAFFVTDEKFYVFDARIGSWKEYEYDCPDDFTSGMFYPQDDCIILVLKTSDAYGLLKNVAYSAHTASFNQTEHGCHVVRTDYNHGYCAIRDLTGFGDEYHMIGYSAFDNQFDWISYTTAGNENGVLYYVSDIEADMVTAYTVGFRTLVSPSEQVKAKFYGYSTILGEWNTAEYDIDWDTERYYGSGYLGGRYTLDHSLEQESEKWRFYFYSADNGLFEKINTDLVYTSTTSSFTLGGSVFGVFDADKAWGYNPITRTGKLVNLEYENSKYFYSGEDYVTLSRYDSQSDLMKMYFYNGENNRWQSKEVSKNMNNVKLITPHVFLFDEGNEDDLVIYSSFRDTIMILDFDEDVSYRLHGNILYAGSGGHSLLLNAEDCNMYEKNFEFTDFGMGTEAAAFYDKESRTLHGFTTLSNKWTTKTIDEEPYTSRISGQIGFASAWYNGSNMGKIFAYNGFGDSWVELIPEGSHVVWAMGKRTGMVVRDNYLYAFHPYDTSAVQSIDRMEAPSSLDFGKNYPNPFSDYTTIDVELDKPAWVIVKVYNTMGSEVCSLVDTWKPAGKFSITWDGEDSNHRHVSPGIYYYHIIAGPSRICGKMLRFKDF